MQVKHSTQLYSKLLVRTLSHQDLRMRLAAMIAIAETAIDNLSFQMKVIPIHISLYSNKLKDLMYVSSVWADILPIGRTHSVDKSCIRVRAHNLFLRYWDSSLPWSPSGVSEKLIFEFRLETLYRERSQ